MNIKKSLKHLLRSIALTGSLVLVAACAPIQQNGPVPVYTPSPSVASESPSKPESKSETEPEAKPGLKPEQSIHPIYGITPTTASAENPAQKAVKSLVDEAWGHYHNGDPDKAIAVAERAQRLDPRSAEVYLLLASSYLVQGKQQLAEQFARRGLSYSVLGSTLRNRLQELLGQLTSLQP